MNYPTLICYEKRKKEPKVSTEKYDLLNYYNENQLSKVDNKNTDAIVCITVCITKTKV